ncbi:uncharacterized protein LOC117889723 isoform X1 [Drosophila subobscura]|uniref:uncharacterized protein LOC117889723 isoform X1 n=1 Tax=Drosophila subobscura TaxID=7241 RepID=UPI00155A53EF|nr:uncharacterized protein LOC117889723 isoform X1 [Drosophila subobscura]
MFSRQQLMLICLGLGVLGFGLCLPIEESADIKEDVISIDNQTQKVIRVHPQDLPSKKDHTGVNMNSALFQIQTLRPVTSSSQKKYVDSKQMRMRKRRPRPATDGEDSSQPLQALKQKELKAFPKQKTKQQKQLKFIPAQTDAELTGYLNGDDMLDMGLQVSHSHLLPVQMTPGPYPIYYVVSKTNGRFGKFPIKAFGSPAEFSKYLIKSKAEPISRHQRFEGFVRR